MSHAHIPIGLQLYSVRDDFARDVPGTLKAVAAMGYSGVEFFSNKYFGYAAKDLKALLDDLDLRCCGAHIGLDPLLGDALPQTAEYAQELGNPYLVVPGLAEERRNSLAAWKATAQIFSDISSRLKPYGIRLAYHNHAPEFHPMDEELPFEVFFNNTSGDVIMQMDVGHVVHAGADPVHYFKKYPGRAATVHLSEYSADGKALVGDRWERWPEVFAACEAAGKTEWYIVEQESYPYPPLECARRCIENLRRMGK